MFGSRPRPLEAQAAKRISFQREQTPLTTPQSGPRTRAIRMHARMDARLDIFDLPPLGPEEILARVVSDSVCMSSYKVLSLGTGHKRVPKNLAEQPVMLGHEFCGEIIGVGERWRDRYKPGMRFTVQPVLDYRGSPAAIGYSYPYAGGSCTYTLLPPEVMESDCLLPYTGAGWFFGSLAEPVACVLRAIRAQIHRDASGQLKSGIVPGGRTALLGAMGPMGMAALDCVLHRDPKPSLLLVTSRSREKLAEAEKLFPVAKAAQAGISLVYMEATETRELPRLAAAELNRLGLGLTDNSLAQGFDDIFVFAPDRDLVEAGGELLAPGGCLNMFAGPMDKSFTAGLNFYKVHYLGAHVTGTYAAQTQDMREALAAMAEGSLDPSFLVTHVGGLESVTALLPQLPNWPGWKKLIYPALNLPLFALTDLPTLGRDDARYARLADLVAKHGHRWNVEAEAYLLDQIGWQADNT